MVTLLVILIIVAISYIIINRENVMIEDKMEKSGIVLLRSIAIANEAAAVEGRIGDIKSFMSELLKSEKKNENFSYNDIAYAYVNDIESNNYMVLVHINNIDDENHTMKDIEFFKNDSVMQQAVKANGVIKNYNKINRKKIMDLSMPILSNETKYGTIRLGIDLSRMEAEIARTTQSVMFIGLIGVILGFIVSILLASIILKPIAALTRGAEKVAVGEFKHKIKVETQDELGFLARSFNRMTFNISVLYNVSNAMNFISDSDKLLNIILDKALEALQAERGSLMLLNEEDDTLMVKVIRGLDEEAAGFIKIKLGDGVAGYVAASGEPLIVNRGDKDDRFKSYQDWINRSSIHSILCIPLKIEDKVLGVINIVNKANDQFFNENDVKLMMMLGSQATITLSKAKLYEDSITDGMTKLYIHRYFQARMDDELKRARRYKTKLTLLMFDIDHFKSFNDTYGHQQGDIVIQHCANVIRSSIREHIDIPCRYGGEEFTVIMPETGLEGAYVLAERLRKNVEAYEFPGQEKPLHVTISLGISTFPEDAIEKNILIKYADEALYHAKEAGRNNTKIYSDFKDKKES